MTLRMATETDADALVAMGIKFLHTVYADKIRPSAEAMRKFSLGLMLSPNAEIFIAESHNEPIGMIGLMRYEHPMSGEVTVSEVMWWMDPAHRGAGMRLFRLGEAWAKDRGAAVIQMIAPSPEVERFYGRVGYEPVERTYQRRIA